MSLRVAMLCYPTIGGSGLVATELGMKLAERDHRVHIISYASPFKLDHFHRNLCFHQVDPINYPLFKQNLYTFSLAAKIVEVCEDFQPDIVHCHYSIPHSLCAHLAREVSGARFRIVTTLHGTDVTIVGQDKPLFPLNRYGIQQSDAVTTVSQFQRDHTLRYFDIPNHIEVIYNFIDPEVFKPGHNGARRDDLCRDDEYLVMHVSNLRPAKNVMGMLRAFHLAQQEVPARLVVVGDGPEVPELRRLIRELHLADRVTLLGSVDNVAEIMPLADVVLQPSYRESFGMVLLEAMACEVPTVSSNVDGIPEVVLHGETGFIADPDDHPALANHLVRLLRDEKLRRDCGRRGRERAIEHFSHERIIPRYLDCYERAIIG